MSADDIHTGDFEAVNVACRRLIARRVEASELSASESVAVSCLLFADFVKTKRLAMSLGDISEINADEVVYLPQKKQSLFRFLLASTLRSLWIRLTAPHDEDARDADYGQVNGSGGAVMRFEAKKNDRPAA